MTTATDIMCTPKMSGLHNVSFTRRLTYREGILAASGKEHNLLWMHMYMGSLPTPCAPTVCNGTFQCLWWISTLACFHDISFCYPATSRCETTEKDGSLAMLALVAMAILAGYSAMKRVRCTSITRTLETLIRWYWACMCIFYEVLWGHPCHSLADDKCQTSVFSFMECSAWFYSPVEMIRTVCMYVR